MRVMITLTEGAEPDDVLERLRGEGVTDLVFSNLENIALRFFTCSVPDGVSTGRVRQIPGVDQIHSNPAVRICGC